MSHRSARNVPVVMQMEAAESGAACLVMVLAHYGRWIPLEEARVKCGVSRDGSKADKILAAARSYNMQAASHDCSVREIRDSGTFPCIVSWNANHYVVLRGFAGSKALLNDPARGSIKVSESTFERSYDGTALEFAPTEA